ncbi:MAG: hypothetical protein K2H40_13810 [Lachnospiraceae bacterium]|nr:hypothetical protein [Lachnospiraceae bacterium]
MTDMIMTNAQLEDNAEFFINAFCPEDSTGTSMIVAGMVSIIKGNESDLERMKNQKWFERIWYTITGKNKATVKEMQARRDDLNKYLIKIISKLSDMARINSVQAAELSTAILTLDNEFRDMKVSVDKIARALNDKILSLDTYTFIINDIRNGKYPADKPLLSLLDIMSQLDSRTVKDLNRLRQLRETMEKSGFSFSSKINVREYAEQVFSLSEEKVGRILLFCQNLSERSRFLAYTCNLIENYFYLGETDRDVVRTDEAVSVSLRLSKLSDDSTCIVDNMYADLKAAIPEKFSRLSQMAETTEISAYIIGKSSAGKEDLFHVLAKEYENFTVKSIDFEPGCDEENNAKMQSIRKSIQNKEVNCVIYCVDVLAGKFEKQESGFIKSLSKSFPMLKIAIALTSCVNKSMERKLADYICNETGNRPVCLLAKNFVAGEDITVSAFGVDDLVEEVRSM